LRRGLFFSHRDLDRVRNFQGKTRLFFLYTGCRPSSDSIHISHTIPLKFKRWLPRFGSQGLWDAACHFR
ncbi:uncharacterized protein K452DRAFT_235755, partial [Aplosporella prunicola CBS 121167]